jgi:hypothetical protein
MMLGAGEEISGQTYSKIVLFLITARMAVGSLDIEHEAHLFLALDYNKNSPSRVSYLTSCHKIRF